MSSMQKETRFTEMGDCFNCDPGSCSYRFCFSDNSETTTTSQSSSTNETQNSTPEVKEVETESEPEIEYTAVDVSTMMDDLKNNSMKAEDTYNDKYLEITGRLDVIDSNGKYIGVFSQTDKFAIVGVQCYIKDDDVKAKVMEIHLTKQSGKEKSFCRPEKPKKFAEPPNKY